MTAEFLDAVYQIVGDDTLGIKCQAHTSASTPRGSKVRRLSMSSQDIPVQNVSADFLEAVRSADWNLALSAMKSLDDTSAAHCPSSSPVAWLIELNAPPNVVVQCLGQCAKAEAVEADRLGLLELCIELSNANSNALATFKALLSAGLSPNVVTDGGDTLFQHAVNLDRVPEVEELLRYGVDPHQMNMFGVESTSNRGGARAARNAAGALALAKFNERVDT